MANRTRALISKIFNFGIARGIVETNPATHVPPPAKLRSRQRVLTEEEIRILWETLESELLTPAMAATFKLRLLTAQRGIEVMSMRWEDIDVEWWTIPPHVAKNGLAHRTYLSPQARAVLEELRIGSDDSAWVFPSPTDDGHLRWVQKAARQLRAVTGFDWTPHDLRRTAAGPEAVRDLRREAPPVWLLAEVAGRFRPLSPLGRGIASVATLAGGLVLGGIATGRFLRDRLKAR